MTHTGDFVCVINNSNDNKTYTHTCLCTSISYLFIYLKYLFFNLFLPVLEPPLASHTITHFKRDISNEALT